MPMLPARHYESDHTRFMKELMERRLDLTEEQRKARAIWWDKDPRELDADREMAAGKVPQKPYVYLDE
jgi:hypothetical protein